MDIRKGPIPDMSIYVMLMVYVDITYAVMTSLSFYLPPRRRPGMGDIKTPPVRLSVTYSFRTVTRKHLAVFYRNFAGTCIMSWGSAYSFLY